MEISLIIGHNVVKRRLRTLYLNLFFCAVLGWAVNLSTILHRKPPRHCARIFLRNPPVMYHLIPPHADVYGARLQRAAAMPELCYSFAPFNHPRSHPHTPHGPRLPETEMLPEQMYHDPHIIHLQSTNTHTPKAYHRQTPILKPAAVCSAPSPAAANSVSSFKSLPKALTCSFSSAGRVPAPKPVNHPDELSASKQPLAPG